MISFLNPDIGAAAGYGLYQATYWSIGKVVRSSVEEANMKDGKIDIDSLEAIAFDPYTHGYYKVGGRVGEAFKDGLKLK